MLLRTNDAELFYTTEGKGPDVVLLHPFPSCHEFWAPIKDKLAAKHRLIMPDLRGLGESQVGEGDATMQKHAEDLARLCDELKMGKAVFIGCSIGGYILFEFWRKFRERMTGLVLANTKASADNAEAKAARFRLPNKCCSRVRSNTSIACCRSWLAKLPGGTGRMSSKERGAR